MDKTEEILRKATEIISEEGIDKLTTSNIAKMVNLSKATLYHYFSSKEEILSALFERGHRNMMKNGFQLDE